MEEFYEAAAAASTPPRRLTSCNNGHDGDGEGQAERREGEGEDEWMLRHGQQHTKVDGITVLRTNQSDKEADDVLGELPASLELRQLSRSYSSSGEPLSSSSSTSAAVFSSMLSSRTESYSLSEQQQNLGSNEEQQQHHPGSPHQAQAQARSISGLQPPLPVQLQLDATDPLTGQHLHVGAEPARSAGVVSQLTSWITCLWSGRGSRKQAALLAAASVGADIDLSEVQELEWLGSGAHGCVFLGTYRGRKVAVKKLKDRAMVEREASMLAQLDHENVVGFLGRCLKEPVMCLMLEYCPQVGAFPPPHVHCMKSNVFVSLFCLQLHARS